MILTKFFFVFAIIEEVKAVPGVSILSLIDMVSILIHTWCRILRPRPQ